MKNIKYYIKKIKSIFKSKEEGNCIVFKLKGEVKHGEDFPKLKY